MIFSGLTDGGCFVDASAAEVTSLLKKLADGDQDAGAKLVPLVYDELRRLAASRGSAANAPITPYKPPRSCMRPT